MAKRRVKLELGIGPADARRVCLQALGELGWDPVGGAGGPIRAYEDFARLHCHCPPAAVEIALRPGEAGTSLDLEVRVPGWGIVSSRQLHDRVELLTRHVAAAASQETR